MILPVSTQQAINLDYFRSFDDERILSSLKEAGDIWFRALMIDCAPEHAAGQHQTIAFWQQNRDDLEVIAKERNLI